MTTERIAEQGCAETCQFPGGCLLRRDGCCVITGQWAMVRVPAGANIATRECAECGMNHSPYSCGARWPARPVELHDCQHCGLMHAPGPCPGADYTPPAIRLADVFDNPATELRFASKREALDTFLAAALLQSGSADMVLSVDWGEGDPWYFYLTHDPNGEGRYSGTIARLSVLANFGKLGGKSSLVNAVGQAFHGAEAFKDDGSGGYDPPPPIDREFIADNMDFPPNFDNGPNPLGSDY